MSTESTELSTEQLVESPTEQTVVVSVESPTEQPVVVSVESSVEQPVVSVEENWGYNSDPTTLGKSRFEGFSYYEAMISENYFASFFPSMNTTHDAEMSSKFPIEAKLFDRGIFTVDDLKIFCGFLVENNDGLMDFIMWLFPKEYQDLKTYDAQVICDYLNDLTILEDVATSDLCRIVKVGSSVFPDKTVEVRLHKGTSPQKAIDTVPLFRHKDGENLSFKTLLGYKKRSYSDSVNFNGISVPVLHIGRFGYLIGGGEHVNANQEGAAVNQTIAEHKETINNYDAIVHYKDIEIANRACIEEIGIEPTKANAKFFLYGISCRKGRDERYCEHFYTDPETGVQYLFNYNRPSESILVVSIIDANFPEVKSTKGFDHEEIDITKRRLIPVEEALQVFCPDGECAPAFAEHANQFRLLYDKLPLFADI